jgi:hypothetical protein
MVAEKFNKPSNLELFTVANTVPEIFAQLDGSVVKAETKWFETK